ncbi:MAG TPA: cohesin domain-containing protein [Candidatus Saccharimonadales bacterium]|nr:cohesin domain-containing protein [Candidatus Saccharimonadales bacterium]
MRCQMTAWAARGLAVLLGVAAAARPAAAVRTTAGTGSGLAGQVVDVPVNTTDLTGLGVLSYQFAVTYDANLLSVDSVVTTGTLSAPWGPATSGRQSGKVSVSAAGATALAGSGPLVLIRFHVNPAALGGGGTTLVLQSFLFNEGSPVDTTANGSFSVGVTPTISVSPNTGELVRGATLAFTVSGSVTNPVAWATTDPTVATISSSGLLTGVAPGLVKVFAVDNAGLRDTTNGNIQVDGAGVTVAAVNALQGQMVAVPVTVTSLNGLGVRSGQFAIGYNAALLTPLGATTAGTLLAGYGSTSFGVANGQINFTFAGATDLTGSGTLFILNFQATTTTYGYAPLPLNTALFNETLPALRSGGSVNVTQLPTLTVSPPTVTLLAGQQQQFTVGGSPALPVVWTTLNPSVATINSSGLLTAVAGGVTQVRVTDANGDTASNTSVTVYDFQVTLPASLDAPAGSPVVVPINVDRDVSALGVFSAQYTLIHNASVVTGASAPAAGLTGAWGPPVYNSMSDRILVSSAGAHALGSGGPLLASVTLNISPLAVPGTYVPLTLSSLMFNEGHPVAQVVNGQLHITNPTVGVGPAGGALRLAPAQPNPLRQTTRVGFSVPAAGAAGARVRLTVYSLDGRAVRALLDQDLPPGDHQAFWDGRDDRGRTVAAGAYVVRLEWGGRHLERKVVVVR